MKKICSLSCGTLPEIQEIRELSSDVCPVCFIRDMLASARTMSCGLGVFCRDGLAQLYQICADASSGHGRGEEDLKLMREICEQMRTCNECELSVAVAERVLASLDAQQEEWMLHLERSLCTSLQCYYTLYIAPEVCTGCTDCLAACGVKAIRGDAGMIHVLDPDRCTKCLDCVPRCSAGAIRRAGLIRPRTPEEPVPVGSFQTGGGMRKRRRKV